MNRITYLFILPVLLVTMGSYCEVDVIDDPGFQFWCGETLCAWTVEEGAVRKVPTWHEHDYAVELVGSPVVISQQAAEGFSSCVRIELIADVETSAMLTIEIDYGGDGNVDWTSPVSREGFRSLAWEIRPGSEANSDSVFIVRKAGEGRAALTQLRAYERCHGDT
jgi:hypothetical protein